MRKLTKAFKIVIITVLVAILILVILIVSYLYSISCKNEMMSKYYSPCKNYLAEVYYRDCGGSSSDWIIDVIDKTKGVFSKDRWSRVFISDRDNIGVEWTPECNLKVMYPGNSQIFKQLNSWQDVKIEYVPINATK